MRSQSLPGRDPLPVCVLVLPRQKVWGWHLTNRSYRFRCTACFTGEYAVKPDEVLSTDIHERHLNDRPKDEKKLGE